MLYKHIKCYFFVLKGSPIWFITVVITRELTVFLYDGLFIAASNIGMTSPIGTSSGSCSTAQNNLH